MRDYLDYYLSPDVETDFAVMLNGPWGAGKTHFTKLYLDERERKAKAVEPLRELGYLYASLYGIRSTAEIIDQFFAQANPILNSKAVRFVGTILSRSLNWYLGSNVNSDEQNKSAIKEMALRLDGRVLVFDDLERCAMPVVDAMGFINSFVEHDGLKVIVIANEDDIPPEQKADYAPKKEKLVGKTLRVASDPQGVLESLVEKLTHPTVIDIVRRESHALLRTFDASEKQNFRSMRAVLADYERLVSKVDRRLQDSSVAMAHLLLFMMATGIEFRGGTLSARELAELPNTRRSRIIAHLTKKEKSPEILKAEFLDTTYPEVRWDDPIVPPDALAKLFETGIVDTALINLHLQQHPLVVGYAETPAWRQLWNWYDLPRKQYIEAKSKLIRQLEGQEVTHPGIILHIAGIVISIASYGDRILGGDKSITGYLKSYTETLVASGTFEPDRSVFSELGGSYAGLGYGANDTPEFQEIYNIVENATNAAFAHKMEGIAQSYIDRISDDPEAYATLYNYGVEDGNYADAPFLQYIDPKSFSELAIKDWVLNGRLLASLSARYEMEKHKHVLTQEYPWIQELRSSLEGIAACAESPQRQILEAKINSYFDKIDENLGTRASAARTESGDEPDVAPHR
ncbi:P-loop NTPase fold protein [Xanthobacter versatilis]|uniref:P-loop NTPase fold protein n=1 Tax=Xanthobacter autotrophicus (strain ATCC BAA-1158 / Py2) TaxID=78245 RepID=UPI003727EBA4